MIRLYYLDAKINCVCMWGLFFLILLFLECTRNAIHKHAKGEFYFTVEVFAGRGYIVFTSNNMYIIYIIYISR